MNTDDELSVDLAIEDFEISQQRQVAVIRALSDVEVESRSFFGTLCLAYVRSLVSSKLGELGESLREDEESLVELDFPQVRVRLDRIPAIRRLVDVWVPSSLALKFRKKWHWDRQPLGR